MWSPRTGRKAQSRAFTRTRQRPVMEPLEARWLFSADLFPADPPPAPEIPAAPVSVVTPRRELIVVDASVADIAPLLPGGNGDRGTTVEVVVLDAGSDGIRQVTELLARRNDLDAVHVISHGRSGAVQLGTATLDAAALDRYADQLSSWAGALRDDADLLFYGCDVASGPGGTSFLERLASLTGADIAASDDLTGGVASGGDWELERAIGSLQAASLFPASQVGAYTGTLHLDAVDAFAASGNLDGSTGGTGWADAWNTDNSRIKANGPGLTDPTGLLPVTGASVRGDLNSILESVTATRNLSSPLGADGTTAWIGFLIQPNEVTSLLSYMGLLFGSTTDDIAFTGYVGGDFVLEQAGGIGRQAVSGIAPVSGQTAFIVVRIDFAAGNDTITTYVNPTPGLASPDSAFTTTKSNLDLGTFTRISIATGRGLSANDAGFDELRIGTSFADVAAGLVVTTTADGNASGIAAGNPTHTVAWLNANRGPSVSLREAIIAANNTAGIQNISFDIATPLVGGLHTIQLTSALPAITDAIVLNGTTEPDFTATPVVALDGTLLGGTGVGLDLRATGNDIHGMAFTNFGRSAISVDPAATAAVSDSLFTGIGGPAIDLGANGTVQTNDAGDGDGGANNGLNFPVIYSALANGSTVTITGEARAGTVAEFFVADGGAIGNGGASALVGTGTVGATGTAGAIDPTAIRFSFTFSQGSLAVGNFISATATESSAMTSEFAANVAVSEENAAPVLDSTRSPTLSAILEDAGAPTGAVGTLVSALVDFATPSGQIDNVTDANTSPQLGIAVVAADTSNGAWWYSTNDGAAWSALGSPTAATARLLASDSSTRLYFQSTANYAGTVSSAITFRAWDRTSGVAGGTGNTTTNGGTTAFSTATDTASITVTAVDDAPTITAIADRTIAEDSSSTTVTFTIGDVDNAMVDLTLNVWSDDQSLIDDSDLLLTGAGASRSLAFVPVANANGGPVAIHLQLTDGTNTTTETFLVTVTAQNDPPVNSAPSTANTHQDTPLVFSSSGSVLSVSDIDAATSPIEVTLTADLGGTVTLASTAGLTFTAGTGIGNSVVTFSGTITSINAALNGLQYQPGSGYSGTASLTMSTSDLGATGTGGALTDTDVVTITIAPNVPATVTLSVAGTTYTEGDSGLVLDSALTVSDPDNATLVSARVRFSGGYQNGQDELLFTNQSGITGTWNASTGALYLSGTASLADYQTALRTVSYRNTSEAPSTVQRTLTIDLDDGSGGGTAASLTLDVVPVNDSPSISAISDQSIAEDASATTVSFTVGDVDNAPGALTVTVWSSNQSIIDDNDLSLSGAGTNRSLSFVPVANASGGPVTITVQVTDGTNASTETFLVTVTAQNDAPVNSAPSTANTHQDTVLVFSSTGPTLSVSDIDAASSPIEVTLTADLGGTVTLASASGLTFTTGTGIGDSVVTFRGTITSVNAALNGLQYQPGSGYSGTASLTMSTSDLGATGTGGALTDTDVVTITIAPNVPATVTLSVAGRTYTEGHSGLVLDAGLTVSDPDSSTLAGARVRFSGGYQNGQDELLFTNQSGITGTWNASTGTLNLSGTATLADYETALRTVRYRNTSEVPSTAQRTVTIDLDDGSGSGTAASLTVDVVAVNDAPALSAPATASTTEDTGFTFSVGLGTAVSISDPDAGSASVRLQLSVSSGTLTLASQSGLTFSSGANGTSSMTVSGTLVNLNAALDGLVFSAGANAYGSFSLEFEVNDLGASGIGGSLADTATVNIVVASVNDPLTLPVNGGEATSEGSSVVLSTAVLYATDTEDSAAQITYRITTAPAHGQLTRSGTLLSVGSVFTQSDIDAGLIAYAHDGSETTADEFRFDVRDSDGATIADQPFSLTIAAVDDTITLSPPSLRVPTQGAVTLTPAMLVVTDADGPAGAISFSVRNVTGGSFQRGADSTPITTFTQGEVATGDIVFVATPGATAASFEVSATDGTNTTPFIAGSVSLDAMTLAMGAFDALSAARTVVAPSSNAATTTTSDSSTSTSEDEPVEDSGRNDRTVMEMAVPRTPPAKARSPAGAPDSTDGSQRNSDPGKKTQPVAAPPNSTAAAVSMSPAASASVLPMAAASVPGVVAGSRGPDLDALSLDSKALAVHQRTLTSAAFVKALDQVAKSQTETEQVHSVVVGSTTAVASSLSVGYILWLMRGGALAASLLASLPAWRSLDPLPILGRDRDDEPDEDGPDDPLEKLFNRARAALERRDSVASKEDPAP